MVRRNAVLMGVVAGVLMIPGTASAAKPPKPPGNVPALTAQARPSPANPLLGPRAPPARRQARPDPAQGQQGRVSYRRHDADLQPDREDLLPIQQVPAHLQRRRLPGACVGQRRRPLLGRQQNALPQRSVTASPCNRVSAVALAHMLWGLTATSAASLST